ncbi:hypothetical protein [Tenacibaculum piscium]|uniref:hypothetical protein n=1 Tax=Tenacibaculum piscium TaxID=1458515 RepID=UPI001F237537|nr:hypothetical protein [Tenacibaculum piscium]
MNFFKKIYNSLKKPSSDELTNQQEVNLSLDDSFVHNFINKGGKFLYCTSIDEVSMNLIQILQENNWYTISCSDFNLLKITQKIGINTQEKTAKTVPFFTTCEHLIASNGDILFSSNQLGSEKLPSHSEDFIVYATTSQLAKNMSEGLTGIKTQFSGNIPTNICSTTNYKIEVEDGSFLSYGNSNSKNLYLLLFEDL